MLYELERRAKMVQYNVEMLILVYRRNRRLNGRKRYVVVRLRSFVTSRLLLFICRLITMAIAIILTIHSRPTECHVISSNDFSRVREMTGRRTDHTTLIFVARAGSSNVA